MPISSTLCSLDVIRLKFFINFLLIRARTSNSAGYNLTEQWAYVIYLRRVDFSLMWLNCCRPITEQLIMALRILFICLFSFVTALSAAQAVWPRIKNWRVCGMKRQRPILMYVPAVTWRRWVKLPNFRSGVLWGDRDSKWALPGTKWEVLPSELAWAVLRVVRDTLVHMYTTC